MLTEFIVAALAFAGTLTGALAAYFWYQGDSEILFETDAVRDVSVVMNAANREIHCRCLIPLTNRGRQQGMVVNVFCQPMYYGKIMEKLEILPRLRLLRQPMRESGYWEAVIIKKNTSQLVELELTIRSHTDLNDVIREIPWLTVIIHYQVVSKSGISWHLAETRFNLKKLQGKGDGARCR